jgi:hypothetical protein
LTATEWTINQLIEERAQAVREEPQPLDQWEADKRARQEREHDQQRWEWVRHHHRMAGTLRALAAEHVERAKLLEGNDA